MNGRMHQQELFAVSGRLLLSFHLALDRGAVTRGRAACHRAPVSRCASSTLGFAARLVAEAKTPALLSFLRPVWRADGIHGIRGKRRGARLVAGDPRPCDKSPSLRILHALSLSS